jgi:hypothetical protein
MRSTQLRSYLRDCDDAGASFFLLVYALIELRDLKDQSADSTRCFASSRLSFVELSCLLLELLTRGLDSRVGLRQAARERLEALLCVAELVPFRSDLYL